MSRPCVHACATLLVVALASSAEARRAAHPKPIPDSERWVVRAGQEDRVRALLADVGPRTPRPDGCTCESIAINRGRIDFTLSAGANHSPAHVILVARALGGPGDTLTESFAAHGEPRLDDRRDAPPFGRKEGRTI